MLNQSSMWSSLETIYTKYLLIKRVTLSGLSLAIKKILVKKIPAISDLHFFSPKKTTFPQSLVPSLKKSFISTFRLWTTGQWLNPRLFANPLPKLMISGFIRRPFQNSRQTSQHIFRSGWLAMLWEFSFREQCFLKIWEM